MAKANNISKIKKPQQQRSIEKREHILVVGLDLICKKGYYHTNTAEIAAAAGVSTGIIYRYFPNKKAILIEGIQHLMHIMMEPITQKLLTLANDEDSYFTFSTILDELLLSHRSIQNTHTAFETLAVTDSDLRETLYSIEEQVTQTLADIFTSMGKPTPHMHERLHLIYNLIEEYCHNVCFHPKNCLDYSYYKDLIIRTIITTLNQE